MNEFFYYFEIYLKGREALQRCQVSHGPDYEEAIKQIEFGKKGMKHIFDKIEKHINEI